MARSLSHRLLTALALALASAAQAQAPGVPAHAPSEPPAAQPAQTAPPFPRADPLDSAAPVPPLVHRPALPETASGAADSPIPWREANDEVARIGGWRAYLREASRPENPAADPAAGTASGGVR